jgi:toluene monooxygenase system protein A
VWFDCVLPNVAERAWLKEKYPESWPQLEPMWQRLEQRWQQAGPHLEWHSHGLTPIGFCNLCQLVLAGGTPQHNSAVVHTHEGQPYIFCSEPCAWIFKKDPERYASHQDVVKRILAGKAPPNLLELVRNYFGLTPEAWGKDARRKQERATTQTGEAAE